MTVLPLPADHFQWQRLSHHRLCPEHGVYRSQRGGRQYHDQGPGPPPTPSAEGTLLCKSCRHRATTRFQPTWSTLSPLDQHPDSDDYECWTQLPTFSNFSTPSPADNYEPNDTPADGLFSGATDYSATVDNLNGDYTDYYSISLNSGDMLNIIATPSTIMGLPLAAGIEVQALQEYGVRGGRQLASSRLAHRPPRRAPMLPCQWLQPLPLAGQRDLVTKQLSRLAGSFPLQAA